jgi:hypothetical protein
VSEKENKMSETTVIKMAVPAELVREIRQKQLERIFDVLESLEEEYRLKLDSPDIGHLQKALWQVRAEGINDAIQAIGNAEEE